MALERLAGNLMSSLEARLRRWATKGVLWIVAGLWTLANILWGEDIGAWVKTVIPRDLQSPAEALRLLISYGPPLVLIVVGLYLVALNVVRGRMGGNLGKQRLEFVRDQLAQCSEQQVKLLTTIRAIGVPHGIPIAELDACKAFLKRDWSQGYAGFKDELKEALEQELDARASTGLRLTTAAAPSLPAPTSREPEIDNAEPYASIRVADYPAVLDLFRGAARSKLFPLLESERLFAWACRMGSGEQPPLRLPGNIWQDHSLVLMGDGTANQTFIRTKFRQESKYYDLHLSRAQVLQFWPNMDLSQHGSAERISLTAAARLMYDKASPELKKIARKRNPRGESSIVGWGKSALICAAREGIGTLHGKREAGLCHERIPNDELASLWSLEEDAALRDLHSNKPRYVDVEIAREDVILALAHYENDDK